ncbi:MAG: NAD(P)(+) transhydrogenase (Re/Si-specific) subunit alpha [Acidimicrobiaceae bacterium]|nr:NAD(P)(+) transhydrogenase (Re/Si-specific) subunit alpha [Acidimicrobiaceae bacterium]
MRILVLGEQTAGDRRVALTPESVETLVAEGHEVIVESGAGAGIGAADDDYQSAGAGIAARTDLLAAGGLVVGIDPLAGQGDDRLGPNHVVVGLLDPVWRPIRATELAATGATGLSLDLIPRTTRAQAVDVLSSMATVAGFQAVLLAAQRLPKIFPLLITAAGTVPPAKVLVLGAGVAGLQAVATARRLGAVVEGFDIRPEALEQIRSLGGRSIEPPLGADGGAPDAVRIHEALTPHVADSDVVVATAQIPGRRSPLLVTADMVATMRPGSLVVDLAIERGGNCEVAQADAIVEHQGVSVLAPTNLASGSALTASRMFATNLVNLIRILDRDGEAHVDPADDVLAGMLVVDRGEVVHPAVREAIAQSSFSTGELS